MVIVKSDFTHGHKPFIFEEIQRNIMQPSIEQNLPSCGWETQFIPPIGFKSNRYSSLAPSDPCEPQNHWIPSGQLTQLWTITIFNGQINYELITISK